MTPLPVIQPPPPRASATQGPTSGEQRPLQTAGMMNDPDKSAVLMPLIVKALSTVFDPEMPVNIYDLGLVYDVIVEASSRVGIRMTLTAPACPAAQFLPGQVKKAVEAIPGVTDVKVDIVWDPPWSRDRMSDAAKLQLGMF
jgi:FeS assembly SUF system protein